MTRSLARPLRIVQAAAFPFPSAQGSQVYVRGMARALARRGHEVTVVCYGHGEGEVDSNYRVVRTPRVPGYNNLRAGPDWVKPGLDIALGVRLDGAPWSTAQLFLQLGAFLFKSSERRFLLEAACVVVVVVVVVVLRVVAGP